jgi:hypothetical protein
VKALAHSEITPAAPPVEWVRLDELHVDYLRWEDGAPKGYQRPLDEPRVDEILREFDENRIGIGVVNRRPGGTLWIVDFNPRVAVLKRLGRQIARAEVYDGLTPEEEADLYYHLNHDRKPLNQWNKFGARGTSGDPIVQALIDLAAAHGFKIGTADRSLQSIAAVTTLERVYGYPQGPRLLGQTLATVNATWPRDVGARDGVFIAGLALFIFNWDGSYLPATGPTIDWRRFAKVFSDVSAPDLVKKCKQLKIEAGFAMNAHTYALGFREFYNGKSNFTGRLEGRVTMPSQRGYRRMGPPTRNRVEGRNAS